jgi:DNA helicase-2/ATP-dependent DNA helicase PcrA
MPLDLASLLNPAQLEAATWPQGPICIIAGAGSGKTRVITHRLAYLVEQGLARPEECLAVTFTNKAAKELTDRVERLLPGVGHRLWVSTFHAAAARIIREAHLVLDLPRNFLIYDQDDAERLIKQVCKDLSVPPDRAGFLGHRIEKLQHDAILPAQFTPSVLEPFGADVKRVYEVYWDRLRAAGAVDFGGLIVHALKVLREFPTSSWHAARVAHAVVDEYQDVNPAQAGLVTALFPRLKSLAVVGDDDQSIYGWRGASADNLLSFSRTFSDAKVVHLTENYRSTRRILRVANDVISRNPGRLGKELWTQAPEGPAIHVRCLRADRDEATWVVEDCQRALHGGLPGSEAAILYRTNAQSRPLEEALHRANLRYRILGGLRFYERREVKDLLAYLKLCVNPRSEVDLRRIINVPPRAIGQTTLDHLQAAARGAGVEYPDALRLSDDAWAAAGIKGAGRVHLREFANFLHELRKDCGTATPAMAIREVMSRTRYESHLNKEEDAEERMLNIQSLLNAASDFEEDALAAGREATLEAFLERASLQTTVDEPAPGEKSDVLTLMTLHAAKGLEFRRVYMVGLEEGLLPSGRALAEKAGEVLSEERRLCYVGMTRAREYLLLSSCQRRMVNGQVLDQKPSRFLLEIPEETTRAHITGDTWVITPARPVFSPRPFSFDPRPTARVDRGATTVVYDSDAAPPPRREPPVRFPVGLTCDDDGSPARDAFPAGTRVQHAQFGVGTVVSCSGLGPNARVEVEFPRAGQRRILARHLATTPGEGSVAS